MSQVYGRLSQIMTVDYVRLRQIMADYGRLCQIMSDYVTKYVRLWQIM